jgi:hypothetical protein
MTVAERELDPLTVACFITGTHDLGPDGVMRAMERFKHPDGQKGISDYQRMKEYVRDGVEKAPEFEALAGRWDWKKVVRYEEMAEGHAVKYGFPRLIDVSPFLSIKNRVGNA